MEPRYKTLIYVTGRHCFIIIIALLLVACGKYQMPPFSNNEWKLANNHVTNADIGTDIDFGGGSTLPITNSSNGDYGLNFITDEDGFNRYDKFCQRYFTTMLSQLPMAIDSIEFILADRFAVLQPNALTQWPPDVIRQADGVVLVAQANPPANDLQPLDELWRNLVFDKKMNRIFVIDRFYKNGKHLAIVYTMQNEDKLVPFSGTFHYDIFNPHNVQSVGTNMETLLNISISALSTDKILGYNDYIHSADSCFMAGDYISASNSFESAFHTGDDIQGMHLYNAACAAALAGLTDVAFERLMRRLALDTDWYINEPNKDNDLMALHDDARWAVYCDSIKMRRDRIEKDYNQPLRRKLLSIAESDQSIRQQYLAAVSSVPQDTALVTTLLKQMQDIDAANQEKICEILDSEGFAGTDKEGNASMVYWLVIQHASVELQHKYFPLFVQAAERGDISRECVALMDDRIAMFENRPQKYGTQIVDGKLYDLAEPDNVDALRKQMGMPPLDEYLKQMNATR